MTSITMSGDQNSNIKHLANKEEDKWDQDNGNAPAPRSQKHVLGRLYFKHWSTIWESF